MAILLSGTNCIQTEDLLPGSDAQQLSFKDDAKLPLTDVNVSSPNNQSSEEEDCSADEDPKEPDEDSYSESGGSSENVSELNLVYRPHFHSDGKPLLKSKQSDTARVPPQGRGERIR
ncbi:hypothetical protein XENOCAPTIV_000623 [Xenoophorus captivus]|uniref:Uncharacterized protein n=1 Tax=Xenoophorus captivus TaxID=1517983 RepID=A0ABV0RJV9_9TELE